MIDEQYLTFKIQSKGYGLQIAHVREIIGYDDPVQVPMMPSWVKGIINLRDHSVPVIDLGLRFFSQETEINRHSCIVIFNSGTTDHEKLMGLVVDTVSEVVSFQEDELEESPDMGTGEPVTFISGIGRRSGTFYLLLDIEKTLDFINSDRIYQAMSMHRKSNSDVSQ